MMAKVARFVKPSGNLSQGSCLLGVSKDQLYYQGESLHAILQLINNSNFSVPRFVMYADALDAYNLMISNSKLILEEAREIAMQEGEAWLASADGQTLQKMVSWSRPVIRWMEIIEHNDFSEAISLIENLYLLKEDRKTLESKKAEEQIAKKLSFSEAVDRAAGSRIAVLRTSMSHVDFDIQRIKPLIVASLKEECAGELVIARNFSCSYELYPGERNSVAMWVHKNLIKNPNILQWITIRVTNHNNQQKKHDAQKASSSPCEKQADCSSEAMSSLGVFRVTATQNACPIDLDVLNQCMLDSMEKINGRAIGYMRLIAKARQAEQITPQMQEELLKMQEFLTYLSQINNVSQNSILKKQ